MEGLWLSATGGVEGKALHEILFPTTGSGEPYRIGNANNEPAFSCREWRSRPAPEWLASADASHRRATGHR